MQIRKAFVHWSQLKNSHTEGHYICFSINQNTFAMSALFDKFNDGGPFFTYPLLILMIVVIILIVQGFIKQNGNGKIIALIASLSWFAVAWGFLGRTAGLIMAFDNVSAQGELTPRLLAGGLKMAILNPLFAFIVFLIARAGIILLIWMKKNEAFDDKGKLKE
jgi:hypothetical protein